MVSANVSPLLQGLLNNMRPQLGYEAKQYSDGFGSASGKSLRALALLGASASGFLSFSTLASAYEAEHGLECASYPWPHKGGAKARAAEIEVVDGPNDEGEMFTRPGKLSDRFPQPYANEQAAQSANGGASPPDPSLITKAWYNGQNYVFTLLTGYHDPPAGVSIREGLHIALTFLVVQYDAQNAYRRCAVEYEDGTPATEAQMGKDVVTFCHGQ